MNPNSGAHFTHADRPDQPNLYFWKKISQWDNSRTLWAIKLIFCMDTCHDHVLWIRIREPISPMQTGPTSQISIFEKKFQNGLTWPSFVRFGSNLLQRSLISLCSEGRAKQMTQGHFWGHFFPLASYWGFSYWGLFKQKQLTIPLFMIWTRLLASMAGGYDPSSSSVVKIRAG